MRREPWRAVVLGLWAVLGVEMAGDGARAQEAYSLAGTVTDTAGAPLPGATVRLTAQSGSGVAVTDERGRYSFAALSPDTYEVVATLAGFRTRTRQIDIGVTRTAHLDMTLRGAPLEIADEAMLTPEQHVRHAQAIAHIRIATTRVLSRCQDDDEFDVVHDASVLSVIKGDVPGVVELVRYLGLQCPAGDPLAAGQRSDLPMGAEFVMLLHRLESDGRPAAWSPGKTFPVINGRVQTQRFNGYPPGMELDRFKAALVGLLQ